MPDLLRARNLPSMQLVGTPERATLDLNALATLGVRLVGRLAGIRDGTALFSGSLPNVCALADLKLGRLLDTIDAWAARAGVGGDQPPQRFAPTAVPAPVPLSLDLRAGGIASIVWATGYRPELSWLHVPVFDRKGRVVHDGGVTAAPGLYLIGMPFLRRRKSSLIDGAAADAAELTDHLASLPRHARRGPPATVPRPAARGRPPGQLKEILMHTTDRHRRPRSRQAVAGRDREQLAAAFTDTVRLRALLPGGPVESHGRDAVLARFAGWFADFDTVELVDAAGEPVADRLLVHYRLTLAPGTHPLGLHPDADRQDRRRPAGHPRPAVFRLPRDQRPDERGRRCVIRRSTAWGDYDRDNPFPLFAQVRADGPVHQVTLPDGQRAWLIVRHAEARAALNDPRLSKDMHAALAHDGAVVAEGLPGPAFARHMLSVDPPDHTRLRGLAAAAFSRSRVTALRPRVQADRRRPARRAAPRAATPSSTWSRASPSRSRSP